MHFIISAVSDYKVAFKQYEKFSEHFCQFFFLLMKVIDNDKLPQLKLKHLSLIELIVN